MTEITCGGYLRRLSLYWKLLALCVFRWRFLPKVIVWLPHTCSVPNTMALTRHFLKAILYQCSSADSHQAIPAPNWYKPSVNQSMRCVCKHKCVEFSWFSCFILVTCLLQTKPNPFHSLPSGGILTFPHINPSHVQIYHPFHLWIPKEKLMSLFAHGANQICRDFVSCLQ